MGENGDGKVLTAEAKRRLVKDLGALLAPVKEGDARESALTVRVYWQLGNRLVEEGLTGRANYGAAVTGEIAEAMGVKERLVQDWVSFRRTYETPPEGLLWTQYRELSRVKDAGARAFYEKAAVNEGWGGRDLGRAIREGRYRKTWNEKRVDRPTGKRYIYKARVTNVVDGDTVDCEIDVGFDVIRRERLRLAGIDAPEMDAKAGPASKAYVQERLAGAETVTIQTRWEDKYGRYVAHLFYGEGNADEVYERGHYLNAELVLKGLAKRY